MSNPAKKQQTKKNTAYARWYDAHKESFAARRKARYQNDPEYRARQIENAATQRAKAAERKPRLPEQYRWTQVVVAEHLEVAPAFLRGLRARNLMPEPYAHGGKLYYTAAQLYWLEKLVEHIRANGYEITPELQTLTDNLHSHWND